MRTRTLEPLAIAGAVGTALLARYICQKGGGSRWAALSVSDVHRRPTIATAPSRRSTAGAPNGFGSAIGSSRLSGATVPAGSGVPTGPSGPDATKAPTAATALAALSSRLSPPVPTPGGVGLLKTRERPAFPPVTTPAPAAGASVHELTAEDVKTWLDGYMPAALNSRKIAGAIVAVVHNDDIISTRGYGYSDLGGPNQQPTPVDVEGTLFRVGSVSKIPAAIAVMQLVEAGILDLDVDIEAYVQVPIPRAFNEPITLRHLLTHTAGFEEAAKGMWPKEGPFDLERYIMTDPPHQVFAPGTTPAYSNYGISLASYIVERTSGMRFEDYVRINIFEPLGMESTTYEGPLPAHLAPRMSKGYVDVAKEAGTFELPPPAAGSMTTSAPDFARFMVAQLQRRSDILSESGWEYMWTPDAHNAPGAPHNAPAVGLTYMCTQRHGHRAVGHGGDTTQFHAKYEIFPETGIGLFIAVNSSWTSELDDIRNELFRAFADRYLPEIGSEDTVPADISATHAQEIAGTYEMSRAAFTNFLSFMYAAVAQTKVTPRSDGTVEFALMGGRLKGIYREVRPYVWREVGGDEEISATISDGQIRLNIMGIMTFFRQRPSQAALVPVAVASSFALGSAVLAWPAVRALRVALCSNEGGAGLLRRNSRGPLAKAPVSAAGRAARIGGAVAAVAPVAWLGVISRITPPHQPTPDIVIRALQGTQALACAAVIPAAADFARVAREVKRGKVSPSDLAQAALLPLGLAGMTWWGLASKTLEVDISY
ncbi:MAG: serine hydrolase domain-containing protein [Actinomycetaceae bacterium]|nr:serine hydrolase domain-containing protein [Actinomycetaceae bacterium]